MQGELILRPGKERSLRRRHPWIYDTAVARVVGKPARGATVAVRGADGAWLAWAAYSPDSTLRARCWSFAESSRIDADWLTARVRAAVARRAPLAPSSDALRLVFGEADELPGFVADRYGGQLVVQFQAAGVDAQREILAAALADATGTDDIYERSDSATRKREGLEPAAGVLRGNEPPELVPVTEHGVAYRVDVRRGHKTGFYIDQRDNRLRVQELAQRLAAKAAPRVLNCFCYTGGFSLAAARGGAGNVLSIDSSADALALAREHWRLNGFAAERAEWREADVFEALRALQRAGERFDLIVLDPPKFASSHHHVDRAARAYKDINLNALRLLAPGGYLATFSCSGAIDVDLFQKIVAGAVADAQVDCQLLQRLAAGEDHPLSMAHPEGEYLKGLLLRRL
ncbi:MAG TPA: class I SAM-dependent rRNA methyltransferase [Burkholderiaceae bacterium]|nr:class I SAM-dependent rRNA methyltransferase [Burkholderiaceae bacterium]